jgi:hypothetical protein
MDPEFLILKNYDILGGEKFKKVLFIHHKGIYQLFEKLWPIPASATEIEIKQVFAEFINDISIDYNLKYSIIGYLMHMYLTYWAWHRVPPSSLYFWRSSIEAEWTMVDCASLIQGTEEFINP